ncbi:helix-hairpin-helix domain-containing protein, partial [Escherichia coli]|uniref:helix-hairpin-helix domain-containing protein n=1 Tax=Escherichia coli TaxID=562 RepID=UPI0021D9BC7A
FVRLGLPLNLANRICNYREKGGQFRKPEDFQKIYGLSVADFERLRPFISINGGEKPVADFFKKGEKRAAENFEFDPNTASFE